MGKPAPVPDQNTAPVPVHRARSSIKLALDAAQAAITEVGADRVESVEATGNRRVTIQPAYLTDGEGIARTLGLNSPLDHRMMGPGYTLWCGTRDGVESQVRGTLRQPDWGLL